MPTLANPNDVEALIRRLATIRTDSPRRWGRMTPHQMICHLADAMRMAFGERRTALRGDALARAVLKWAALRLPFPWPPGIRTSAEIDAERGGTQPSDFAADRAEVESLIRRAALRDAPIGMQPHPVFGTLTRAEWLHWAWRHTDHHLRQFGA
jgi:Protein of unknown function (DUF1569)